MNEEPGDEVTQQLETIEQDVIAGELTAQNEQVLQRFHRSIHMREGVISREHNKLRYLASCGHMVHDFSEIGGKCMVDNCDALVCHVCVKLCQRCQKLLCPAHQKYIKNQVFCSKCRWIVFIEGMFTLG